MNYLVDQLAAFQQRLRDLDRQFQEAYWLPCDIPDCLAPTCRGRSVEERKSAGKVQELYRHARGRLRLVK